METTLSIIPSLDKSVIINVEGWEKNLKILYSIEMYAGISYLCWKIYNTEQVFKILATTVYEKHGLNFADHFKLVLTTFREDYKNWESQDFIEDWMKRYHSIFNNLIK